MLGQAKQLEHNGNSFIERLADQFAATANAKYIYAEPVERDGVAVIPVARAAYGLGGGSGKKAGEEGSGGGGGVALTPVGFIEIKNGEAHFHRIITVAQLVPLIATASAALLTVFWGISKLIAPFKSEGGRK